MELQQILETTGTCRFYRPDPVPDAVLARVLGAARFAPSGGNRQPVRLVAVRDPEKKRQLRDWYLPLWKAYLAPLAKAARDAGQPLPVIARNADHMAEHLHEVPVLVVVCAVLTDLYPTDHKLGRLSVVGGASIYPGVQSLLLKAREEGLGSALTTLLCVEEPRVRALLGIPDGIATTATLALGYPARPFPTRLARRPVHEMAFLDAWGSPLPTS